MLEKAAALRVYDALRQADVVDFLTDSDERFDCVVAADVFIYVGELREVFRRLAERMPAGGVFSFSVEQSTDGDLALRPSLRYAHSEAGIRRLAQAHGFRVVAMERRPVRQEQREPVAGLFFWLERM